MPSAVLSDEVAQLQIDIEVIMEWCNALSKEIHGTSPLGMRQNWPRRTHSRQKPASPFRRVHHNQTLKKSPGSVVDPRNTDDTGQNISAGRNVLDTPHLWRWGPRSCLMLTLFHFSHTNWKIFHKTLVQAVQVRYKITSDWPYLSCAVITLMGRIPWW